MLTSQDGGETWTDLPPPPLHDLHRIQVIDGLPVISGTSSPAVINDPAGGWSILSTMPLPLTGLLASPLGALLASTPHGLYRSDDRGGTWSAVVPGTAGCVTQMTFGAEGRGWAGVTPDGGLLRTEDDGRTWKRLAAPFGVLPLVALQALSGSLIAATYDERQHAVAIWRSEDAGGAMDARRGRLHVMAGRRHVRFAACSDRRQRDIGPAARRDVAQNRCW